MSALMMLSGPQTSGSANWTEMDKRHRGRVKHVFNTSGLTRDQAQVALPVAALTESRRWHHQISLLRLLLF
ncbi:hypothetical protein [Arthrobacter sp. P2b]|uniref:hypothetical protein n=1 Tax=Arthrobacter sp. P2b TaxID=1938741 RepID=UPI0015926635|nr:hypothetical protein [Arthrobacter sp. P2b]